MPDKFDPYREALVVETDTIWPDEFDEMEPSDRERISNDLHGDPASTTILEYVRMHTGFCRQITVTRDDVDRLKVAP